MTPSATCIEGEWDDVLPVIRLCHARVRAMSPHVVTLLKIEDDESEHNKLTKNVVSVEEKVGHPLKREEVPPLPPVTSEAELAQVKAHT